MSFRLFKFFSAISVFWISVVHARPPMLFRVAGRAPTRRARVLLTTITLNFCFGLIRTVLVYFVGGYLFEHVLAVPSLKPEVAGALPWTACLFPMALVSGAAMGALESRERFLTANLFQMAAMILSQVAPVIMAVFVSPSLNVVIPTIAIAQGLNIAIQLVLRHPLEG